MNKNVQLLKLQNIQKCIFVIRGKRVMLDSDLALIYEVTTARLNQQVRRNIDRFPEDFMFQLNKDEYLALMLQNATSKGGRGGRRKLPLVFTEHGAIMAANVLNSKRANQMSIFVVRAFVKMREMIESHINLLKKIEAMEKKYDIRFHIIFKAIKKLMNPPKEPIKKKKLGF